LHAYKVGKISTEQINGYFTTTIADFMISLLDGDPPVSFGNNSHGNSVET
jgi:hypothetical protein